MLRFIAIFIPPIISLLFYFYDEYEKVLFIKYIFYYSFFLISNLIFMCFILYIKGKALLILDANIFNIGFLFKYCFLSFIFSIIFPVLIKKLKNLAISIVIEKNKNK